MSFQPPPIATLAAQGITTATTTPAARTTPTPETTATSAVKLDAVPASPPPEVTQAMGVADDAYNRLAAKGTQLSFQIDERTGRLHIEVHDMKGNVLFTIPPSKALDVASGGDLDQ